MKASAIICELNPLHNGHKYIMEKAKEDGNPLVLVMSGNFVQRGSAAVLDKWTRAKAALSEGADLVLELPDIYSCSSAEYFSKGAVSILKSSGLSCDLYFGTEEDNEGELKAAVKKRLGISFLELAKDSMKDGSSYAAASEYTIKSNNILALEYIAAINELGAERIRPVPVRRIGSKSHIEAATEIRKMLNDFEALEKVMPVKSLEILKEASAAGRLALSFAPIETYIIGTLRKISPELLAKQAFVSEGLENKLISEAMKYSDFDSFVSACTSKRYTASRIRRAAYSLVTGITSDLLDEFKCKAPYIRVLGFTKQGASLVSEISVNSDIPVIINASDRNKLTGNAAKLFSNQISATALFEMCMKSEDGRQADIELTHPIVKI